MGIEIRKERFDERDFVAFADKLRRSIEVLRDLLRRPGFGVGEPSVGAELELDLVDDAGRPMPINQRVLDGIVDDRVTLEVDRFNMEINARPSPLAGRPFSAMARELVTALGEIERAAATHGAHPVAIGILPTLTEKDLGSSALTEGLRYRALSHGIQRIRGEPFAVHIEGDERLDVTAHDVTFEGANTSFQLHLRVTPEAFARTYNAAQIATAFVLAVSGNSPYFLGKRLWHETRVALFRQSVDDRWASEEGDWRPARVSFGHGWVRQSAHELFAESVALHDPLLPQCGDEDPAAVLRAGRVPHLGELRLHHGTVWRWNRAVYDDAAGGHLRIEFRALPAGPTVNDMVANAALAIGLTQALASTADALVTRLTFGHARRNFYEAARHGLGAELLWPDESGPPRPLGVSTLAGRLLPLARQGLVDSGVEPNEADEWLSVIQERIGCGITGAIWQRNFTAHYETYLPRERALAAMLARYRELSAAGSPVHRWPLSA